MVNISMQLLQVRLENAELFYKHVTAHTEIYPEGNNVTTGCACLWHG